MTLLRVARQHASWSLAVLRKATRCVVFAEKQHAARHLGESGSPRTLILSASLFGPGVRVVSYRVEGAILRSSHKRPPPRGPAGTLPRAVTKWRYGETSAPQRASSSRA